METPNSVRYFQRLNETVKELASEMKGEKMKKIPTLFERIYENHKVVGITDKITEGCEEAFKEGLATVKWDGSCCAIIDGVFYKRYDAKKGKNPPEGAIPCQPEPDPVTGHWPHWVKVDPNNPADRWFVEAYNNTACWEKKKAENGTITFEAIGKHFQGNPYNIESDSLRRHGCDVIPVRRTFKAIKEYLAENEIEGIVFWLNGEPVCKIKRTDFGFEWPLKEVD